MVSVYWIKRRSAWGMKFKKLDGSWGDKSIPREVASSIADKKAAETWAVAWFENYNRNAGTTRGPIFIPAKTTRSEWPAWLQARYDNPNVKGSVYSQNESHGRLYILPHRLADLPLKDWRPEHAREFVIFIREKVPSLKSSCAQGNVITSYSAFLSSQPEVLANPFHHSMAKSEQPERRTSWGQGSPPHIEPANVPKFLACQHESIPQWRRVKNAIAILGGCREGELMGLRWRNIDLEAEIPHYTVEGQLSARAKDGTGGLMVGDDDVKTKASFRVVPLHPFAVKALRSWFEEGWSIWVGREPKERDYVFVTASGSPFRPQAALQLRQDCLAAGIPDRYKGHPLDQHSTRRTFSTLLHAAGVPVTVVDEVLGHYNGSEAAASYVQIALPPHAEVVKKITLDFVRQQNAPAKRSSWEAMQEAKNTRKRTETVRESD